MANCSMDVELLKKVKKLTEKCIEELGKKSDINAAETSAARDGFELIDMIDCKIKECEMPDKENEQYSNHGDMHYSGNYSGHDIPYRRYNITAYGHPNMHRSYNGNMGNGNYSGGYGVQGWYNSDPSYCGDPYMYGTPMRMDYPGNYSRHSIADRIVSLIEHNVMSGENSEFENQEARRYINMIRQAAE